MRTLAYQWLGTHHASGTSAADFAPAYTVTSVDRRPTACATCTARSRCRSSSPTPTPFSEDGHRRARATRRSTAPRRGPRTSSACCRRRCRAAGRRRRPCTGTDCSAAPARSRAARSRPASPTTSWAARPTGSACRGTTSANVARNLQDMSTFDTQVDHMLQGFVNFQFLGRLINSPSGFVTDRRVPVGRASRCSRRTTATSWATARAASWAAPCRRSRPSGAAPSSAFPAWTTAACC